VNRSVAGRVKEKERGNGKKNGAGTVGQQGWREGGKATQANRQVRDEAAEGGAVNKRGD